MDHPWDGSVVTIEEQSTDGSTVAFSVKQTLFGDKTEGPDFISVYYETSLNSHECVAKDQEDAQFGVSHTYTAVCTEGFATVSVYIRNDGTSPAECDTCGAPNIGDVDHVAYYLTLPCKPECEPSPVECYGGVMAMAKDTDGDAMCTYEHQPFAIEEQLGDEVVFFFHNTWSCDMTDIELMYDGGDGEKGCHSLNAMQPGDMYPMPMKAACVDGLAEIEVFVQSGSIAYLGDSKCTDPGEGTCSFTWVLPCSESMMCPPEPSPEPVVERVSARVRNPGRRSPEPEPGIKRISAQVWIPGRQLDSPQADEEQQGFVSEEMKKAAEPNEDADDVPYCVHEDYPCTDGDEENMVYVCHYSTREGYQTFCIPETDSDIMQFYTNDYCGPCEGWNGVNHAGQSI